MAVTDAARTLVSDYRALQGRMSAMKEEFAEASKAIFTEEVKALFEKFPKLVSFSWTQYTPYFNDGEPCIFSAHTDYPSIQFGDEDEREDEYTNRETPGRSEAVEAVSEFLSNFTEEQYELTFGDHSEVIVTKDGVEVEEYSHD
jgi:hypothetical protein